LTQHKHKQLQTLVTTIQRRWGDPALHTLDRESAIRALPTGFAALDRALGIGGIPRGQLTELSGVPTSGAGTLALKLVASVHVLGESAVYFDVSQTFDADYAVRCGVRLDQTLIIRPDSFADSWDMAQTLITNTAAGIIVYDPGLFARHEPIPVQRLMPALNRSGCVLLILNSHEGPLSEAAAVRLQISREHWLQRRTEVQGYRTRVSILKNRFARPARPVSLLIGFSSSVQGDGV